MRSTTKPPESQNMNLASKLEINKIRLLAADYIKLSLKPDISEEEADRIGEILVISETNNLLSFLINEIDLLICEKLDISTEHSVLDVESLFISRQTLPEASRTVRTSAAMFGLAFSVGAYGLAAAQQAQAAPSPTASEPPLSTPATADALTATAPVKVSKTLTHTVQEGQTLWKIAELYGIDATKLANLNSLQANAVLSVGQVLQLPTGDRMSPLVTESHSAHSRSSYDLTSWKIKQEEELYVETTFGFPGYGSGVESITSINLEIIDSHASTVVILSTHLSHSYEVQAKEYEVIHSFFEQQFTRVIESECNAFCIKARTTDSIDASIDRAYLDLAYSKTLVQAKWDRTHHTKPHIIHFSGHGSNNEEIMYSWQNTNFAFEVIHDSYRADAESLRLAFWQSPGKFHKLHSAFHHCRRSERIKLEAVSVYGEILHSIYLLRYAAPTEVGKSRPVFISDSDSKSVDQRTKFNDIAEFDNLNNDKQNIFRILSTLLSSLINQSKNAKERLIVTEQHKALAREYLLLSILEDLSDSQADRISEIYRLAESDPTLNFIIGEVDHIVLQETGFFSEENLAEYSDQKAEYSNQKARLEELINLDHGDIQNPSIYKEDENRIGSESLIASLREAIKNQSPDNNFPTYVTLSKEMVKPLKSQEQLTREKEEERKQKGLISMESALCCQFIQKNMSARRMSRICSKETLCLVVGSIIGFSIGYIGTQIFQLTSSSSKREQSSNNSQVSFKQVHEPSSHQVVEQPVSLNPSIELHSNSTLSVGALTMILIIAALLPIKMRKTKKN